MQVRDLSRAARWVLDRDQGYIAESVKAGGRPDRRRERSCLLASTAWEVPRSRKGIRGYLAGQRQAGVRAPRRLVDPFEAFAPYCAQRLADDPHLWARTLFDELVDLGYAGSYPTMTRQLRVRALRPACEPCRPAGPVHRFSGRRAR